MTHDEVQAWLDRYIEAWASYDPAAIGDLFTTDAEYRYHPSDPPITGREAIVARLDRAGRRRQRPRRARHLGCPATSRSRSTATGRSSMGWSRYYTDATKSTVRDVYDNVYLLEFGPDGRCRSFTEFFVERPKDRI